MKDITINLLLGIVGGIVSTLIMNNIVVLCEYFNQHLQVLNFIGIWGVFGLMLWYIFK